ncbi:hypothetical protein AB0B89_34515 [Sphaerisporangium sp. NPDC049002]|uniref:hypothetical protein n=1 Tax=Sphaerisporangium sp. NPDC049002 TaxID=3155392 RepID=UPI00340A0C7F
MICGMGVDPGGGGLFGPVGEIPVEDPGPDFWATPVPWNWGVVAVVVVVSIAYRIYAEETGTPLSRRGAGPDDLYFPDAPRQTYVVGVWRAGEIGEAREMAATWYEVKTWAERESSRFPNVYAWVRSPAGEDGRVKIWTWRRANVVSRRKAYLWESETDRYLTERERAAVEAEAERLYEEES